VTIKFKCFAAVAPDYASASTADPGEVLEAHLVFYERGNVVLRQDSVDPSNSWLAQALKEDDVAGRSGVVSTVANLLQPSMDAHDCMPSVCSDEHIFVVWAPRCLLSRTQLQAERVSMMRKCHVIWVDTAAWGHADGPKLHTPHASEHISQEDFAQQPRNIMPRSDVLSAADVVSMCGSSLQQVRH
jgi:hypothetical protein